MLIRLSGYKVSISPIFYEQLFCTKVFCATFFYLQCGFETFVQKIVRAKAACKMLIKLATGGDICKEVLSNIHCPTLIVRGDKDNRISAEQTQYLENNIKNSR